MMPGLTRMEHVQVTTQTDEVVNIPCGTRGGVLISLDKVEVVNMLDKSHVISTVRRYGVHYDKLWIFDKLHHTINQVRPIAPRTPLPPHLSADALPRAVVLRQHAAGGVHR